MIKKDIMVDILMAKFGQNEHLKKLLINTQDGRIIEASP